MEAGLGLADAAVDLRNDLARVADFVIETDERLHLLVSSVCCLHVYHVIDAMSCTLLSRHIVF